jgi:hypothetical protein
MSSICILGWFTFLSYTTDLFALTGGGVMVHQTFILVEGAG